MKKAISDASIATSVSQANKKNKRKEAVIQPLFCCVVV
jgi:hypothetical protein